MEPAAQEATGSTAANGRIAFHSYEAADADIYAMNPDGTGKINLTDEAPDAYAGADVEPAFSPDGTSIAFQSDRSGDNTEDPNWPTTIFDVWIVNADGSGQPRRVTAGEGLAPAWSPDGQRIAFWRVQYPETCGPCDRGVYVMDAVDSDGDGNGENPINLTNDPAVDYQPDWSPDGTQISFISNREDGEYSLWTIPAPQPARSPTPGVALLGAFFANAAFAKVATSAPTPVANSSGASSSDWAPKTPPKIWSKLLPREGSRTTDLTPVIGVKATDVETDLVKKNVSLLLDGIKIPRADLDYFSARGRLRYVPASDLSSGVHSVRIVARDPQGLVTRETWRFSVATL
jgi:Tol biopolymer transport system component